VRSPLLVLPPRSDIWIALSIFVGTPTSDIHSASFVRWRPWNEPGAWRPGGHTKSRYAGLALYYGDHCWSPGIRLVACREQASRNIRGVIDVMCRAVEALAHESGVVVGAAVSSDSEIFFLTTGWEVSRPISMRGYLRLVAELAWYDHLSSTRARW